MKKFTFTGKLSILMILGIVAGVLFGVLGTLVVTRQIDFASKSELVKTPSGCQTGGELNKSYSSNKPGAVVFKEQDASKLHQQMELATQTNGTTDFLVTDISRRLSLFKSQEILEVQSSGNVETYSDFGQTYQFVTQIKINGRCATSFDDKGLLVTTQAGSVRIPRISSTYNIFTITQIPGQQGESILVITSMIQIPSDDAYLWKIQLVSNSSESFTGVAIGIDRVSTISSCAPQGKQISENFNSVIYFDYNKERKCLTMR